MLCLLCFPTEIELFQQYILMDFGVLFYKMLLNTFFNLKTILEKYFSGTFALTVQNIWDKVKNVLKLLECHSQMHF